MSAVRAETGQVSLEIDSVLNTSVFMAFVAVTLFIVIRASRNNKTAAD